MVPPIKHMNATWQSFLEQSGALIEDGVVRDFGNAPAELGAALSGPVMSDLSQLGVISIKGEDAGAFLQGQLSCDVNAIALDASTYGSYCTAKGRALATFILWRSGAGYFMALSRELLPAIRKRLTMYVLRAKVSLTDVSSQVLLLGLTASGDANELTRHFGVIPATDHHGARDENGLLLRFARTRWLWVSEDSAASRAWPGLARDFRPVGAAAWSWLDIRAGLPWVTQATQEQFVPQMINLHLIGAVNFQKGCYPGQEIVARTQYLGKLKRRMYLANIATADSVPMPGTELFSDDLGGQASGMVVNAQASPYGGYDLLAVAQATSVDASVVRLGSPQGPALAFQPLPYALT